METIRVRTSHSADFVDVTERVRSVVSDSAIPNGIAVLFVPHTTAGITINENADPTVKGDLLAELERLVPAGQPHFKHREGNSHSHIKASLVGNSQVLPVSDGDIVLGTWQGIFLCEFDGPRERRLVVTVISG